MNKFPFLLYSLKVHGYNFRVSIVKYGQNKFIDEDKS